MITFSGQTTPFFDPGVKISALKTAIRKAVNQALREIKSRAYDLVILDEFNTVLACRYATLKDAEKMIRAKPEGLELIFTGRGAPKGLIHMADYVTEMRMIKHPFRRGVKARKGIEY